MRLTLLILLSVSYADVIHVPADYSTIQEGIDAAAEDDIVVVSPATYEEWTCYIIPDTPRSDIYKS